MIFRKVPSVAFLVKILPGQIFRGRKGKSHRGDGEGSDAETVPWVEECDRC